MKSLRQEFGADDRVIKWLEKVLDCDYSSARRKYICETKLSIANLEGIARKAPHLLNRGLQDLLPRNAMLVHYSSFRDRREINLYLRSIIKRFEQAYRQKAELKYVARDLPLFYFLSNRHLADFKFSLWAHQLPGRGMIHIGDETFALCLEVFRLYKAIDSIEVWNQHVLLNQFNMIRWYCSYQKIDVNFTNSLYRAMHLQLEEYKKWAKKGVKEGGGNLDLLFTDFMTMNNGGMLETGRSKVLMSAVSNVNFITFNGGLPCDNFTSDFELHCSYATSVSRSNVLARDRIFNQILQDLKGHGA